MLGVTNTMSMDTFQDDTQRWNDQLNTAVYIFKEQMDIILEARNDVARCQHIIAQQNIQIANLQLQAQAQGAGPSTAQAMTSTSSYSKKVEIFNDLGEYNVLRFTMRYLLCHLFLLRLSSHRYQHCWAARGNICTFIAFTSPYVSPLGILFPQHSSI